VLEDAGNRDNLSAWTHNHPAVCPYRQDEMPSLNGVHVGDVWRNRHTGKTSLIETIKLGGCGTYTDREPVFVLRDEDEASEYRWVSPHPMWSLSEHWEPVTRPGEWPVPWTNKGKRKGGRWAHAKWRCPGYRGRTRKSQHAYWHAYHSIGEHSIGWEATNRIWQMDPELEARLVKLDERDRQIREFLENVDPNDPDLAGKVTDLFAKAA
jgi:hypothetical protein